jgi:hypothetical protein
VTVEQVRSFAVSLPVRLRRSCSGRDKFRVGRIVYGTFARDETVMGFPKQWRDALVETEPEKFLLHPAVLHI